MNVVFCGSSITNATGGFRDCISNWLQWTYRDTTWNFYNASQSGMTTWNNLYRMQAAVLDRAPDLVLLDNANDDVGNIGQKAVEAFARRIWGSYPECKIVFAKVFNVSSPYDNSAVDTPLNSGQQAEFTAIAEHYGIPIVPFYDRIKALVNGSNELCWYLTDIVHPTAMGHGELSGLLEDTLCAQFLANQQSPATLPARLYDNGDYEQAAQGINGTGYSAITGTWSTNGTTISSSEAGATVTYTVTCRTFGRAESDGTVQASVNGSAYGNVTFTAQGSSYAIYTRAAHAVTIKVISGTVTISKFWSI